MNNYDPSLVANKNNNIYGFPFNFNNSELILIPIPWDVTVSYNSGTSKGPSSIFNASFQLDLFDSLYGNVWKKGLFYDKDISFINQLNEKYRVLSEQIISALENGADIKNDINLEKLQKEVNSACEKMNDFVFNKSIDFFKLNKCVGIIGGEHSVSFGNIKATSNFYDSFSILQFDAHCDLRKSYEGFKYSHASIMRNVFENIDKDINLVQIGIRDYCEEENQYLTHNKQRIKCFTDEYLKESIYCGKNWNNLTDEIITNLKSDIYISFDIDGLSPLNCPNTGTPVPGGLQFEEAIFLLKKIYKSGKRIIGFDLCEVAPNKIDISNELDANIGARILFNLSMLTLMSKK